VIDLRPTSAVKACAVNVTHLFLYFLAGGAMTFPLSLVALRWAASLAPAARWSQKLGSGFQAAISLSLVIWIVGSLTFYGIALYIERQKPCDEQHTNQLTVACRRELGAVEH
jgi:hypothetical protein